jgi:hypothetical protein
MSKKEAEKRDRKNGSGKRSGRKNRLKEKGYTKRGKSS